MRVFITSRGRAFLGLMGEGGVVEGVRMGCINVRFLWWVVMGVMG